ncbi:MAG: KUP/HAK/KT family potassium transporter [Polyangiales bacterium]
MRDSKPTRVRGTAVFMTGNPDGAPPVLLHHFKHNKVLHEQVIMLSVMTERARGRRVGAPHDQAARGGLLAGDRALRVHGDPERDGRAGDVRRAGPRWEADTSFYLGRETLLTTGRGELASWRKALFVFLSRNATGERVLSDSAEPGGGARHADRAVSARQGPGASAGRSLPC